MVAKRKPPAGDEPAEGQGQNIDSMTPLVLVGNTCTGCGASSNVADDGLCEVCADLNAESSLRAERIVLAQQQRTEEPDKETMTLIR